MNKWLILVGLPTTGSFTFNMFCSDKHDLSFSINLLFWKYITDLLERVWWRCWHSCVRQMKIATHNLHKPANHGFLIIKQSCFLLDSCSEDKVATNYSFILSTQWSPKVTNLQRFWTFKPQTSKLKFITSLIFFFSLIAWPSALFHFEHRHVSSWKSITILILKWPEWAEGTVGNKRKL